MGERTGKRSSKRGLIIRLPPRTPTWQLLWLGQVMVALGNLVGEVLRDEGVLQPAAHRVEAAHEEEAVGVRAVGLRDRSGRRERAPGTATRLATSPRRSSAANATFGVIGT